MGVRAGRTKVYSGDLLGGYLRLPATLVGRGGAPSEHRENGVFLECDDAMNTVGTEDAELAFVITAKIDETAATLTSAG
jgi:hypothetical protein